MNNTHKKTSTILIVLLLMLGWQKTALPAAAVYVLRYENGSDFICGYTNEENQMTTKNDMSVVFHNPNSFPVMVNNVVTLNDVGIFMEPEYSDRYLNVIIDPDRSFRIDCNYIKDLFFEDQVENLKRQTIFTGVIHSKSTRFLNVVFEFTQASQTRL